MGRCHPVHRENGRPDLYRRGPASPKEIAADDRRRKGRVAHPDAAPLFSQAESSGASRTVPSASSQPRSARFDTTGRALTTAPCTKTTRRIRVQRTSHDALQRLEKVPRALRGAGELRLRPTPIQGQLSASRDPRIRDGRTFKPGQVSIGEGPGSMRADGRRHQDASPVGASFLFCGLFLVVVDLASVGSCSRVVMFLRSVDLLGLGFVAASARDSCFVSARGWGFEIGRAHV